MKDDKGLSRHVRRESNTPIKRKPSHIGTPKLVIVVRKMYFQINPARNPVVMELT